MTKHQQTPKKAQKITSKPKKKAKPLHIILVEKRESLSLERKDIVELTGLSVASISRLESGITEDIKVSNLKKLAQAYDVPYSLILSGIAKEVDYGAIEKKRMKISKSRISIKSIENGLIS